MLANLTADRAPGLRRSTAAARAAARLADSYSGLAAGVTRWRLAAALRAAARPLGLTEPMLRLLEHYIDLSYDADWEPGAEPVITRPLVEIAEHLGKSERQIRNIERALAERGLLAWRDSGNHRRRGRRDRRTGRLLYAYGPSLAPLGARASEILALAEETRRSLAERQRLRIAIGALRRRIRADLAAAAAEGIAAEDLAQTFEATPARCPAGVGAPALAALKAHLATLAATLAARLGDDRANASSQNETEASSQAEIRDLQTTDTCNDHSINGYSIAKKKAMTAGPAPGESCVAADAGERQTPRPAEPARARLHGGAGGLAHVPLALALAAAGPEIAAAAARRGPPSWRSLVEAAREIAPLVGIDATLWGEACGALGREGAALGILILERALGRGSEAAAPPVARPAAWFRSLTTRAGEGRLHLDRSVHALARRPAGSTGPAPCGSG